MNSKLIYYIHRYKNLIEHEKYDFIIEEMVIDLKKLLLEHSNDIELNYDIIETFYNVNTTDDLFNRLDNLENIINEGLSISNIKKAFNTKHEKISDRDKKWLSSNKKKLLELNYEGVELELINDYKVTFEQLLNRHSIFDKVFVTTKEGENVGDNLRRFEDKNENLKNGLDNYYRTGTSRREVGLRKVSGEDARVAVELMINYCESFISGKKYIEDKMNSIIVAISDSEVKESLTPINKLKMLLEDNGVKDITQASKDLSTVTKDKQTPKNTNEEKEVDDKNAKKENPEETNEEENIDENQEETNEENIDENQEEENVDEKPTVERGIEDRQVGVAVLLTVAEKRYFDYIVILKGLLEEEEK
jgi:hypothetical protein